jgi:hypothetical protein
MTASTKFTDLEVEIAAKDKLVVVAAVGVTDIEDVVDSEAMAVVEDVVAPVAEHEVVVAQTNHKPLHPALSHSPLRL